jgi:two-component system, cell cycle sensor histidine kinase and response regulator CckA
MADSKKHKILVVEDEGLIAHDIADRLNSLGHEVVGTVGTAEEAIEQAAAAEIVLMDIRLDGRGDGIEAATAIRERYRIPVIFLTAHADRSTLERAKGASPFGYIVKPLPPNGLNTSIEIAMHKHHLEKQLEEREAWMRTVLGSVADAVVVTDVESRVVMLNPAAEVLTGWLQAEAQGQPISKIVRLIEEDGEAAADEPVALAILRDSAVPLDPNATRSWKLVARGGREMMIEGAAAPVKTMAGTIGAVLGFRDVSARRWEERQIRQSQKLEAIGRLAAGVSSDYTNLLGIVRNQAEQLLRQFGEYSPARKAVEEIQRAAAAAEQINRRLAAFGSRQVSQREVLSLNGLLRRSTRLIESITGDGIDLAVRPHPATLRIKADVEQIEQALMSLVLHACARMPSGGRLLIETRSAEAPVEGRMVSHAMLAVTYTGQEPEPDHLFEPLFEPRSAAEEGMALSMVHAIVTEHGGYISAQRTETGGCRFELLFPSTGGAALLPQPAESEAPSILLIEERERLCSQLHNFFEAHGYNLLEAADQDEALAIGQMHEGPLHLLIADASQEMVAADLLRDHPAMEFLQIVQGAEPGANQIRRPFTQAALLEKVEAMIGARKKLESAAAG